MTIPTEAELDVHGLVTLARRWYPRGMLRSEEEKRLADSWCQGIAYMLNPLIDFVDYAPIILNPHRCSDAELVNILDLNGIRSRPGAMSFQKLRRLAILGVDLRTWRGSFRAHRILATALTGGPAILRTWIIERTIEDESTMSFLLLDEDQADETQLFILGQGPDATEYLEPELDEKMDQLAKPVLDTVIQVPCFALTAWRDGFGGWVPPSLTSEFQLVQSSVVGEYQGLDMGPDITTTAIQWIKCPTEQPDPEGDFHSVWATIWFRTGDATTGDHWEVWVFAQGSATPGVNGDAYVVRVNVGNGSLTLYRMLTGVATLFGTWAVDIQDGLEDGGHRLDVVCARSPTTAARVRVYVDGNPSPWFDDPGIVGSRPDGRHMFIGLRTATFSTGRLRLTAVTAQARG